MEISDNDEESAVFTNRHFEDSSELLRDSRHDSNCCHKRNPYTTLNWTSDTCTKCYPKHLRNNSTSSPRATLSSIPRTSIACSSSYKANITEPTVPIPSRISVDRFRPQISQSTSRTTCGDSSPSGNTTPFNFTKNIPKSLVSSSRFSKIKLDSSYLESTKNGLMSIWPGPFHEIDCYWDLDSNLPKADNKHSSFYEMLVSKRIRIVPEPPLAEIESFIKGPNTEDRLSSKEVPFYDKFKDRRCHRFVNNESCSSRCSYLHEYPKDNGVHCKYYYLHRKCPSLDCNYIHKKRCSSKTKKMYQDKYAKDRCRHYLYTKSCSDVSCEKIHRLPKMDGIHCLGQLSLECTRGSQCDYKHRDDWNALSNEDSKISNDKAYLENFDKNYGPNDYEIEGLEYYFPNSDSENEYPPYDGVGETLEYLRIKKGIFSNIISRTSENEAGTSKERSDSVCTVSVKNFLSTNSDKPDTSRISNRETARSNDNLNKLPVRSNDILNKSPVSESTARLIKRERDLFDLNQVEDLELNPESEDESKKEKDLPDYSNNSTSPIPPFSLSTSERSHTKNESNEGQNLSEKRKPLPEIECLVVKTEIPVVVLSSDDDDEPCKESENATSNQNVNLNIKQENEDYDSDSSTVTQVFNADLKTEVLENTLVDSAVGETLSNLLEECRTGINETHIKVEPNDSNTGLNEGTTDVNSNLKNKEEETLPKEGGALSLPVAVKTEREPEDSETTDINNSSVRSKQKGTSSTSTEGNNLSLPVRIKTEKEPDGSEVSNIRSISCPLGRKLIKKKINGSHSILNSHSGLDNQDSQKETRKEQDKNGSRNNSVRETGEKVLKENASPPSLPPSGLNASVSSDHRLSLCNTSPRTKYSESTRAEIREQLSYNRESLPTINTKISNSKSSKSLQPSSNVDKEPLSSKNKSNNEASTSSSKSTVDKYAKQSDLSKPDVNNSSSKGHKMSSSLKASISDNRQTSLSNSSSSRTKSSSSKKSELKTSSLNKESVPSEKNKTKSTTNTPKTSDVKTLTHSSHASKHSPKDKKSVPSKEKTKASNKTHDSTSKSLKEKSERTHMASNVKLKKCSVFLKNIMKKKRYVRKYNLHKLLKEIRQNDSINFNISSRDKHQTSSKSSEHSDKKRHHSDSEKNKIISQDEDDSKSSKSSKLSSKEHDSVSSKSSKLSSKEHDSVTSKNSKLSSKDHQTSKISSSEKNHKSSELTSLDYHSDNSNTSKSSSKHKQKSDSKAHKHSDKEKHHSSSESSKHHRKEKHSVSTSPKITSKEDQTCKKNPKSFSKAEVNTNSEGDKPSASASSSYRSIEDILSKNKDNTSPNSSLSSESFLSISKSSEISDKTHKEGKDPKHRMPHKNRSLESNTDSSPKSITKDSSKVKDINSTKHHKHKNKSGDEKVSSKKHSSTNKLIQNDSSETSVLGDTTSKDNSGAKNLSSPISKSRSLGISDISFMSTQKEKSKEKSLTKDKLKSNKGKINSHYVDEKASLKRPFEESNSSETSAKKIKIHLTQNSNTSGSQSSSNSHSHKLAKKKKRLLIIESSDESEDSDNSGATSDFGNISKKSRNSSESFNTSDQSVASEHLKSSERRPMVPKTDDTAIERLKDKGEKSSSKGEVTPDKPSPRVPLIKSQPRPQKPCPLSKKRYKESGSLVLASAEEINPKASVSKDTTTTTTDDLSRLTCNDVSSLQTNRDDLSEEMRTHILKYAREILYKFTKKILEDKNIPNAILTMCKEEELENIEEDESLLSLEMNIKRYLVFYSIKYEKLPQSYYYNAPYELSLDDLAYVLREKAEKLKEAG